MPSFPNERDCEHGRQRGKCDACDLVKAEQRIAELEHQLDKALSDSDNWSAAYDKKEAKYEETAATVERLRAACQLGIDMFIANDINVPNTIETMQDAIEATPRQNLNADRREAIEEAVKSVGAVSHNPPDDPHCCAVAHNDALASILNFAKQRYPVKDGE